MLQCCYGNNRKDYDCELVVLRSAILEPESNENTEYISFFVSGSVMLWTELVGRPGLHISAVSLIAKHLPCSAPRLSFTINELFTPSDSFSPALIFQLNNPAWIIQLNDMHSHRLILMKSAWLMKLSSSAVSAWSRYTEGSMETSPTRQRKSMDGFLSQQFCAGEQPTLRP